MRNEPLPFPGYRFQFLVVQIDVLRYQSFIEAKYVSKYVSFLVRLSDQIARGICETRAMAFLGR